MEFLVGCGTSVAAEAGNSILAKIKRHIGYLFSYNSNMKGLEDARVHLEDKTSDASRLVSDAGTKLRDVSSTLTRWRDKAEKLHKEAQAIIAAEKNRRGPTSRLNPWSRYCSSKEAWEMTQAINGKVQNTPDFGVAFDRPAPELGGSFNLGGCMDFDLRVMILNGVLESLKDEEVRMCSLCGMGGVGKTMLAMKLIQRDERDHLFDKVAMVTVSQSPNFEKIQNEIIELLGLKIDHSTMRTRATKLNEWLTNNKSLLILDDVWRMLNDEDFGAIGIPSVSGGCKIVFTSRQEDECKKMGSQHNFHFSVLQSEEAWDLFRDKARKCTEGQGLHETARNISAECGGLLIPIVTIARALEGKPQGIWKDSLTKLQNSNFSGIENVYSLIHLSYDLLNDKEAQSCFLLCYLYPEDHNIPIQDLVSYVKCLDLYEC